MASAPVYNQPQAVSLKNIFFVTDLQMSSRIALPYVIALANRYHSKVILVHALGAIPFTPIPYEALPPTDERPHPLILPEMEELRRECLRNGLDVKVALKDGEVIEVVDSELREEHADLVVLGTHAHGGVHRLLMGSNAEHILRHTKCGVLMVGPRASGAARWRDRLAKIVIATNFEEGSHHALDYVAPIAAENHSEVTLMHVVDEPSGVPLDMAEIMMRKANEKLVEFGARTALSVGLQFEVRVGHPHQEIVRFANHIDADLIVLGRRAGGFFAEHKPATTITLTAGLARCPVLTVC